MTSVGSAPAAGRRGAALDEIDHAKHFTPEDHPDLIGAATGGVPRDAQP